jgi:outer membrane receptor protein involved in Fe transport
MTKYFLLLCLAMQSFFLAQIANAQNLHFSIKGIVIDSLTNKPGEYFTVSLKMDQLVVKSVVSNEKGEFTMNAIKGGDYTIVIGSIGYQSKEQLVSVKSDVNLGNILLKPQGKELKEVAISASKPLIKQESDRITYDLQADPESKVLSVLDMMRKVPLLSVDAEDNIKMKGSSNYRILINGKASGVISRDPKEFLKSMSATNVQKIEVITTPPSKYESEGLSGIINIVTAKKIGNGYSGNINTRVQYPISPGASGNFTFKQGDFGINAYGGTGIWKVGGIRSSELRKGKGTSISSSLYASGLQKINNHWAWGGAELSYEIDSLNLLTAEINPYGGFNQQYLNQQFEEREGANLAVYNLLSGTRYEWGGTDYTFNYQRGFAAKKEHLLTLSYKYFDASEPQFNNVLFSNAVNFNGVNFKQENRNKSSEQTLQLDYINPFSKITVEAGLKMILRNGSANFNYLAFDDVKNDYLLDPSQANDYSNKQRIYGVYNSYILKLKDWSFKAGVRLEGTYVEGNFTSTNTVVNTDYFNFVPAVSMSRSLKSSQSLSLGYTQRIQRPGIYDLNPFVDKSRPNFEIFGNPNLEAVLSNNFELTYSNFKKGSLNLSFSYNFANNTQQTVYEFSETDQITRITFLNIGKDKTLGISTNFSYPITKKWDLSLNTNLNYLWLEGLIGGNVVKNDGLTGYGSFNTSYKFERTWKANLSFNYGAPNVLLQGATNNYYSLGFGGSKDIIKDKLTFSASVANPFQKFRAYRGYTEGVNFTQERTRENYFRRMFVSLNWKFGKLDGSIKKNQRSINNDDVKAKSGN